MVLLKCMDRHEVDIIVKVIHEGYEGIHANGHVMAKKILWDGYYWTTMESDYFNYVKRCHKCQIYADNYGVWLF